MPRARLLGSILTTLWAFTTPASLLVAAGQTPSNGPDIVANVRSAMAGGGLAQAETIFNSYRSTHSKSPDTIEALSWLARGALAAKQFEKADQLAGETRDLALTALKTTDIRTEPRLQTALGTALEVLAYVLVAQGARSDAVYFLRNELETYRDTPIRDQILSNIELITLEGRPAPPLEPGIGLGPHLTDAKGQVVFLFFWAHWCQECKAESPMLSRLIEKYRSHGLTVVAPTRRYGYVEAGRPATPDRELRYIAQVRDTFYRFLQHEPVPVTDANHRQYGVSAVPMHVLIDRKGVVRLYHSGRMSETELEAAIVEALK
jgi:peroxiredoxin